MQREAALVVRVDQLVGRWASVGENTQPREWVDTIVHRQYAGRDSGAAYSVEAVASRDKIARQFVDVAVLQVANLRRGSIEVVDADVAGLENDLATSGQPCRDQILDDFVLSIDCDCVASGQPA